MTEIFEKLHEKLHKDAGKDDAKRRMADFIVWLLGSGNHDDIAGQMIEAGKGAPSLNAAFEYVKNKAKEQAVGQCACVEDHVVFWNIVKYFNLEDCITPEEVKAYCGGKAEPRDSEPLHANAESSPFSVDIDSLFDD